MTSQIDQLRCDLEGAEQILSMFRSLPERGSIKLLLDLRSAVDLSSFVALSRSKHFFGGREYQASAPQDITSSLLTVKPPPQSSLEFELMMRHPIAYPALVPVEAAHTDLESYLYPAKAAALLDLSTYSNPEIGVKKPILHASTPDIDMSIPINSHALNPLCDERLRQLKIGVWTKVAISDSHAASVISLYLETDHPILGLFDADLFLNDLLSGTKNFCSPLLVSALLSWACQAYTFFECKSRKLSLQFWDEAEVLWEEDKQHALLTTVAALALMSLAASCNAKGSTEKFYLKEGIILGKRMGLFGVSETESAQEWLDDHADWVRAASQTSWGVFNWVTLRSLHFRTGHIGAAPHLQIPNQNATGDSLHSAPYQLALGRIFRALCQFCLIVHETTLVYYDNEDNVAPRARFPFAEDTYQRLLRWADELQLDLARGDDNTQHIVIAHIYFHASIIETFRPFLQGPLQFHKMRYFSSELSSAEAVLAASTNQLKRMILVYRARFPSAKYSFLWHTALLYVANAVLRNGYLSNDLEWKFWFQICLQGYRDLFSCFPIAETITRGLLSVGIQKEVITVADACHFMELIRAIQTDRPPVIQEESDMIVDLYLSMTDPLAARVGLLAKQLGELGILEEGATNTVGEG